MCRAGLHLLSILVVSTITVTCLAADLRVQEIPLPKDAVDASYMKKRGDIRFHTGADMKAAGSFYADVLGKQQWKKSKKDNLQSDFWVQSFEKENRSLEVRVEQRKQGCEIRLTPKGFLWDEDLAPRVKDLPIPEDSKEVTYDDFFERFEFQNNSSPEQLGQFYTDKLDPKVWSKSGTDLLTKGSVRLKRASGKATLSISIDQEEGFSHVKISTKGMSWDEIKTAKAAEKKSMKKSDATASKSIEGGKRSLNLPKRVEKPKRGIAQLDKLKSDCVVMLEGKPIHLGNIIAYEAVSYGQWRTKIIATESVFRQQPLIELLKTTGSDEGWEPPSRPYVKLELNDQDAPSSMSLGAEGIAGGGSGSDLEGSAIVEDGRVRGTVKLKTKEFFKKEYSAEITFDVPVLTGDSAPAKLLVNATKLPNSGKLTIGGTASSLTHVTAYETMQFDQPVTAILLTEKPINLAKLKASLAKPARNDDDFNEFQTQVKLVIDSRDRLQSMFIWRDGLSVSSSGADNLTGQTLIEDGRARGTLKTTKPGEIFGKAMELDVSFDTSVIPLAPAAVK